MRKLLYIALLLFTMHNSYAQKIRFTDTSNRWIVFESSFNSFAGYTYKLDYNGDTAINGQQYLKSSFGYIREDTVLGIVYIKNAKAYSLIVDTNEIVLYNYNLNVGDSIVSKIWQKDTAIFVVDKIDTVIINSTKHRVWNTIHKYGATSTGAYAIIEGVGSTCGPWFPIFPSTFENAFLLTCFNNKGISPKVSPWAFNYFDNTTSCKLSVSNTEKHFQSISIIPNPANESSKIVLPYAIPQGSLVVTNTIGQVVLQKEFQNKEQLELGALPAEGIYFCRITDARSGNNWAVKFVYQ